MYKFNEQNNFNNICNNNNRSHTRMDTLKTNTTKPANSAYRRANRDKTLHIIIMCRIDSFYSLMLNFMY